MLVTFTDDFAGKKAGQVCDLDDSVATTLIRSFVVVKTIVEEKPKPVKKPGRPKTSKK